MPELATAEIPSAPFGQYQLLEKIAQGGMAEIFKGKALDPSGLEKTVVIKRILPHIAASPEFVEMLIDEAKIAVMLSHGNIAQIYDLGKVADDYFIVMEYVEGKTLSQIMKRLRSLGKFLPIAHTVYLCAEIANGLDYMHRKSDDEGNLLHIIHRDISPQNIILSTSGTVKIIDFGIAKAKTKISTTDSGILKGKFAYMSPEHAEGERLDHRTDLFSLGIVLFELLTNQRLFKGKNNAETIRKVKKSKVPTPSGIRPVITNELDEIVFKMLQRDRNKRYETAHAVAQDLTRFLVRNYPDFSPREMIASLHDLFPELAPAELQTPQNLAVQEETPLGVRPSKGKGESGDETVAADSEVIREKLKEAEVFHFPEPKPEDSKSSVVEIRERTDKIKRPKDPWKAVVVLALMVLGIGIFVLFQKREGPPVEPPPPQEIPTIPVEPKPPIPPPPPQRVPATGSIQIDSSPRGAKIFLNDIDTNQKTPALLSQLPADRTLKIGLHLEQHKFWEGSAHVQQGQTLPLSVALDLNYGDLEINSLPSGAEVWLNGKRVGVTPYRLDRISPAAGFEILIQKEGYAAWSRSVKVFGGKKEVVNASLQKIREDEPLPE